MGWQDLQEGDLMGVARTSCNCWDVITKYNFIIWLSEILMRLPCWRAMPGWSLSLRSPAIWFNEASPVATELRRDWRKPAAENLRELRMINRVWLAIRSRSGRLGHERPAGEAFDIPSLPARSTCQSFI